MRHPPTPGSGEADTPHSTRAWLARPARRSRPAPERADAPVEQPVVLCVDDRPEHRELAVRALEQDGRFRVETAASGWECLRVASALHPAVIVLDWILPDLSGNDVLAALAAEPATATIPVVVVSGRDAGTTLPSDIRAPAGYLAKPYQASELRAVVRAVADDHEDVVPRRAASWHHLE
jgi:CheY-like chemotaxis protein